MKYLKMLGLAVVAATALSAFAGAGTASATTMEVEGKAQNKTVAFTASLEAETSTAFTLTNGTLVDTCKKTEFNGDTVAPYTEVTEVEATLLEFYFTECNSKATQVIKAGKLLFKFLEKTIGTVTSKEAEITLVYKALGVSGVCKTSTGTDIGKFTGVAAGTATLHITAVLNCGTFLPSIPWEGTYVFTSPNGLGIVE